MENKLSRLIESINNYYWIEERKKKIREEEKGKLKKEGERKGAL